jgi:hypothetical protein
MKIKELIKLLGKLDQESTVIIASGSDYVNFSELKKAGIKEQLYYAHPEAGNCILDEEYATAYDKEQSEKAVVLYPSNVISPTW